MRRREFIALVGGAASWPLVARGQQAERAKRIGVLWSFREDDPVRQARLVLFVQALRQSGWTDGGNMRLDMRWAVEDSERQRCAEELVALAPDVILASASPSVAALQRVTRTIPIVFANVIDPVGAGFVKSLARPGGNTTGFTAFEYSISGKWLELLREIAPRMTRVAVLRDPSFAAGIGQFAAIQSAASSSNIELSTIDTSDAGEIERDLDALAREPNGGVIVTASASAANNRDVIIALASRYRLPNVYPLRYYPASGGLASYGPDANDEFKRAAVYLDRILKGEKPGNLPVQAPTKYDLVINLKTAKAFGLTIPPTLLATADEVIE
jgi:putative tryptophan/tyrosine transport system substrate-binding protein